MPSPHFALSLPFPCRQIASFPQIYYEVAARVRCLHVKGIRCRIYNAVYDSYVFYKTAEQRISYDGDETNTLVVDLTFKLREKANDSWGSLNVLNTAPYDLNVVSGISMNEHAEPCHSPFSIQDYVWDESNFLADTGSNNSSPFYACVDSPIAMWQSFQAPSQQHGAPFEKCHLKHCARCNEADDSKPNNRVCLTPTFHCMSVGGKGRWAPSMRTGLEQWIHGFDADECDENEHIGGEGSGHEIDVDDGAGGRERRYRVDVVVPFATPDIADGHSNTLKDGTRAVQ